MALPDPPKYSPVKFTDSTVDGKGLSAYKPGAWESVTGTGQVDGVPSALEGGTSFTVSY